VVHRVVERHAPGATVIDLTHGIAPHDIRAGAVTLWRAAPWLVPGVILAVVDPGVGTERRAVAIEVAGAGAALVGPDNGLLLPAALRLGPITAAVELTPTRPPGEGATFAGRDVFAPAAAALAAGDVVSKLGRAVPPDTLAGADIPMAVAEPDGRLRAEVLWIDRFGNAQLNVLPFDIHSLGPTLRLQPDGRDGWVARPATAYGELSPGELGLIADSAGLLAVSLNQRSAAAFTGLRTGDSVWLGPGGQ
jgi:S-adenosylmethionine hydrolase